MDPFSLAILLLWLAPVVSAATGASFTNPLPQSPNPDPKKSPTIIIGTVFKITWTQDTPNKPISLTLMQTDGTTGRIAVGADMSVAEYILLSSVNVNSFNWVATTAQNLTKSNLFFFAIYEQGVPNFEAASDLFFLEPKPGAGAQSSALNTGTTSTTTTAASTTSTFTSSSVTSSTASSTKTSINGTGGSDAPPPSGPTKPGTSTQNDSAGGLSQAAQIGLGLGIPLAVIVGVVAGWCYFDRRKKASSTKETQMYHSQTPPMRMGPNDQGLRYSVQPGLGTQSYYKSELSTTPPTPPPVAFELWAPPAR